MLQRVYDIYTDRENRHYSVKSGFTWPGFLFVWIWVFYRRMLWVAGVLTAAWLICLFLAVAFFAQMKFIYAVPVIDDLVMLGWYVAPLFGVLFVCCLLVLHVYVGVMGNLWIRRVWSKRGWVRRGNLQAKSAQGAIKQVLDFQARKRE